MTVDERIGTNVWLVGWSRNGHASAEPTQVYVEVAALNVAAAVMAAAA